MNQIEKNEVLLNNAMNPLCVEVNNLLVLSSLATAGTEMTFHEIMLTNDDKSTSELRKSLYYLQHRGYIKKRVTYVIDESREVE